MDTHDKAIAKVESQLPDQGRMHPVVQAAMQQGGLDPETLRGLLDVQREWEANEARKAYARALAQLKAALPSVIDKDRTVDFKTSKGRTTYRHASLANVMDKITEPLTQYGFSLSWKTGTTDKGKVRVECFLTHSEGHSESTDLVADEDRSGTKSQPQAVASTITLLQRYTALSLLGIATGDHVEPTGEPEQSPSNVNSKRNLAAVSALKKYGKTKDDAEQYLGRELPDWTDADIQKLKAWVTGEGDDHAAKAQKEAQQHFAGMSDGPDAA